MRDYRTSEIAALLGVSGETVRRWCDEGRLATTRSTAGHRLVAGAELARYLSEQPTPFEPDSVMAQSARNRLTGIVLRVERDRLTAIVELNARGHRIVSLMTREAVDELGLEPGDLATAAIKSTNVIVEVPTSTRADPGGA